MYHLHEIPAHSILHHILFTTVKNADLTKHKHSKPYGRHRVNDFSAKAEPGQKIAIVGPTGAGKTTLVNLLMRFYEVDGGEIRIDGIPTRELTMEDVHNQFCMVLQDTWVFEGTLRETGIWPATPSAVRWQQAISQSIRMNMMV